MAGQVERRPDMTPESREKSLKDLQVQVLLQQANLAVKAGEVQEKILSGELEIEETAVTKGGEVIRYSKKPNHRVMADVAKAVVDKSIPNVQKIEHSGLVLHGIQGLNEFQLNKIILEAVAEQEAIDVTAEVIENKNTENNPTNP